jgi:uncharacterized protein
MGTFNVEITIPCGAGSLEGRFLYSEPAKRENGVIICPPHPLLAGNIDNNVVKVIAEEIAHCMPVLLFNYRGVGKSWSPQPELPLYEYWQELDKKNEYTEIINDMKRVIEWSTTCFSSFHLLGYSFGSYVALQVARESAQSYIAITPPLDEHDFSLLEGLGIPAMTILAANDNLLQTRNDNLLMYFNRREIISDTDHFFCRREMELASLVRDFLC